MRKCNFLYFIFFIFLLCTRLYTDKNNNNIEKDNSELTLKERAGKYLGTDLGNPNASIRLDITEQGNINITLSIKDNIGIRTVTSDIDVSNKINDKILDLDIDALFYDPTDLYAPRKCKVTFKFISIQKVSISFTYRDHFYGTILEKE